MKLIKVCINPRILNFFEGVDIWMFNCPNTIVEKAILPPLNCHYTFVKTHLEVLLPISSLWQYPGRRFRAQPD